MRIPNRRLDREGLETTVFSEEEKSHWVAAARVFGNIFWRARGLRTAILVSSCANGLAEAEGRAEPTHHIRASCQSLQAEIVFQP